MSRKPRALLQALSTDTRAARWDRIAEQALSDIEDIYNTADGDVPVKERTLRQQTSMDIAKMDRDDRRASNAPTRDRPFAMIVVQGPLDPDDQDKLIQVARRMDGGEHAPKPRTVIDVEPTDGADKN